MNILGTVINEGVGEVPIPNAKVSAKARSQEVASTFTGEKGEFDFPYSRDSSGNVFDMEVTKDGYESHKGQYTILPDRIVRHGNDETYTLTPPIVLTRVKLIIEGRVRDRDKRDVIGAKVEILDLGAKVVETSSKEMGKFEVGIEVKHVGRTLTVKVAKENYKTFEDDVRVPREGVKDLSVTLEDTNSNGDSFWSKIEDWWTANGKHVLRWGGVTVVVLLVLFGASRLISRPHKHQMPSLVGLTLEAARVSVAQEHLILEDVAYTTNNVTRTNMVGTVVEQLPLAKSTVESNDPVVIIVLENARSVRIPKVVGSKSAEAIRSLKDAKLLYTVEYDTSRKPKEVDIVVKQVPAEEKEVTIGSMVTITVGETNKIAPIHAPSLFYKLTHRTASTNR